MGFQAVYGLRPLELQVFRTSSQKLGLVSVAGKLIKISRIPVLVVKK
jgi:nucleotide-binding universal stress UspA family protein